MGSLIEKYLIELAEILEEDTVSMEDVLIDFDAWDSLTVLSIVVMVEEKTGVQITTNEIHNCKQVSDLVSKLINISD